MILQTFLNQADEEAKQELQRQDATSKKAPSPLDEFLKLVAHGKGHLPTILVVKGGDPALNLVPKYLGL